MSEPASLSGRVFEVEKWYPLLLKTLQDGGVSGLAQRETGMDLKGELGGHYVRVVAIIALGLGLADAWRLLGVSSGPESPISLFGTTGFTYLAIFCLSRLFAAVGLWIKASWGAVLLVGATVVEIGLYLAGSRDVQFSAVGFAVRVVLLASILVIFILNLRGWRERAHD
jgi:hypothetical protein